MTDIRETLLLEVHRAIEVHGAERAERNAHANDIREQRHSSTPAEMVDAGE